MIGYIKNLFSKVSTPCVEKGYKFDPYKTPQTLTEKFDMSNVKEPATSFVECVKNNRKRFGVRHDAHVTHGVVVFVYSVVDTQTGKGWSVFRDDLTFQVGMMWTPYIRTKPLRVDTTLDATQKSYDYVGFPEWLNKDEIIYIYRELTNFYDQLLEVRHKRKQQLAFRAVRDKEKNLLKERQLMIDTYCEEG